MDIWKPVIGVVGAAIAIGFFLSIPDRYVSQSLLRVGMWACASTESGVSIPSGFERARQNVLSDSSLSEILRLPNVMLFAKERQHLALADVIGKMRAGITMCSGSAGNGEEVPPLR